MNKSTAIEIIDEYLAIRTKTEEEYQDLLKVISKVINQIDTGYN